ncbi:MAG: HlyD family efflux transporter periplasmic adaptor subunit [Saprospiraceae bacterium]|nr:HlyD family efflux transporter periplasmic adaptor subunit [Saprospiraceae bacterium]
MAEPRDFVELRSEEVQEILGTPPNWLVQWGTTAVLIGFGLLLGVAWFVRYPDVVVSDKLSITTADPPVEVVARSDGRVALLLVQDTSIVTERQALAVLQNTANYADVQRLDTMLTQWQNLSVDALRELQYPDSLRLGELQADYALFVRDLEDFKFGKANRSNSVQLNIGGIEQQISQLQQSIAFEQKALKRINDQLKIAENFYERQKDLFKQNIISEMKLEEERLKLADIERQRDVHEGNILEKNREILSLRNSIRSANIGQSENTQSSSTRLMASLRALRSTVDQWMQTYVLTAPIGGKVVFNGLNLQQYVRQGESVMTIVPQSTDKIVGRVQLPVEKSGKVNVGQAVLIKLENYPFQEFGMLRGKVASKSPVPRNREYTIIVDDLEVTRSGKLRTSSQKEIQFEQQLLGSVEIITDDKGFLERVLEQISAGFQR